jgi:hypothetical protein
MNRIVKILMERDEMSRKEAEDLFNDAVEDFTDRLMWGEYPLDICEEWFGLEPDYLDDIIEASL